MRSEEPVRICGGEEGGLDFFFLGGGLDWGKGVGAYVLAALIAVLDGVNGAVVARELGYQVVGEGHYIIFVVKVRRGWRGERGNFLVKLQFMSPLLIFYLNTPYEGRYTLL